ncbi:MAG TPA: YciI family protein [Candidatus Limnocylindrales bacterium]|nr:YciI family protein [Candidatus Limnocylindrales bacterium]
MKYFMQTIPDPSDTPPTPELFEEMGRFVQEGFTDGSLVATGGLDPRKTYISHHGADFTVTDGPFTEAKEAVVGWAIVEVASHDEAIELSKRFWRIVGDGRGTIQRVYDPGEVPTDAAGA